MTGMSNRMFSVVGLGSATAISGLGSYLVLILAARGLDDVDYSAFAAFWSISVVLGLGFYFPIEQETARELAGSRDKHVRRILPGMAATTLIVTASVAVSLLLMLLPPFRGFMPTELVLVSILCLVSYGLQFPVRGVLSGLRSTNRYSAIVGLEGLFRILLPMAVLLSGASSPAAFALAVALSTAFSVIPAISIMLFRRKPLEARATAQEPPSGSARFVRRALRLVAAALSIQLLLNSAVLIARGTGSADPLLAGQILACLAMARIPIFGYQVLQVLYLPRVAAHHRAGRSPQVRRLIITALAITTAVAIVDVVVIAFAGEWIIGLLFGDSLVATLDARLLISLGVAVYMIAIVLSDTAVAIGLHGLVMRAWLVSAAIGLGVLAVTPGTYLSATLPLICGSLAAVAQLAIGLGGARKRADRESATTIDPHGTA